MKILVTIPHYHKYDKFGAYGSSRQDEKKRCKIVEKAIGELIRNFCLSTAYPREFHPNSNAAASSFIYEPADTEAIYDLDIVLCTTERDHFVDKLNISPKFFKHRTFSLSDPLYLGFKCHQVLKENLGQYDYYCFMEDDLVIRDKDFFRKLAWFENQFGSRCVLQPNRMAIGFRPFYKLYADPEFDSFIEPFINFDDGVPSELRGDYLGESLIFHRTHNPHAGCFFLSERQYELICEGKDYGTPRNIFAGPLETAATYDLMTNLNVYRVAYSRGWFFEIEHFSARNCFLGNDIYIDTEAFSNYGLNYE